MITELTDVPGSSNARNSISEDDDMLYGCH